MNMSFPFNQSVFDLFTPPSSEAPGPTEEVVAADSAGGWRSWIGYPIMGVAVVVFGVAAVTGHLDRVVQALEFIQGVWARVKGLFGRQRVNGDAAAPVEGGRPASPLPVVAGRNMSDNEILEAREARVANSYV